MTPQRPSFVDALRDTKLITLLAAFDPHVAGTPPIGLDLPGSDIDILCHAPDQKAFACHVWGALSHRCGFVIRQWMGDDRPVVVGFEACGWAFEIFGSPVPVARQAGWRHFLVERRLLTLGGDALRTCVMRLRHQGYKTEPAFAAALRLDGDPYAALLALEAMSDSTLSDMLTRVTGRE